MAVLVDLAALREEAHRQGAELAQHKLRNGIAQQRSVARAVAAVAGDAKAPSGFEPLPADGGFAAGVQFAAKACELLAGAGCLVLAPATPAILALAQALRQGGHTVELAGLQADPAAGVRRLGRDCLFVP
ncbi:MAG: hypothetical protein KF830_00385 [Planctomycetes bacterium]|nr:hypothetical protein [Planctomycetota bacterium]